MCLFRFACLQKFRICKLAFSLVRHNGEFAYNSCEWKCSVKPVCTYVLKYVKMCVFKMCVAQEGMVTSAKDDNERDDHEKVTYSLGPRFYSDVRFQHCTYIHACINACLNAESMHVSSDVCV
jgi:hypothetical protein